MGHDKAEFVAVVNHFKSKGAVARDDKDQNDGQGNNPNLRAAQARALTTAVESHDSVLSFAVLGRVEGVREGTLAAARLVGFIAKYFVRWMEPLQKWL